MNYEKKFSIGLSVLDDLETYNIFLDHYAPFIKKVYFSAPLGKKFHSRIITQRVLSSPDNVSQYLQLIKSITAHGIQLELLFNTRGLCEKDIAECRDYLDANNIHPDEVGLIDIYYDWVRYYFPDAKLVYSFNNFPQTIEDYFRSNHHYDQYVTGRLFIRDTRLFEEVHKRGSEVVLLINNGCSFTCGGCGGNSHCHESYYKECFNYTHEYMYARQSIMPFEINDGYLDVTNVDTFKISTRNDNVRYIANCIESYVNNKNSIEHLEDYFLWARLSWHRNYYEDFNVQRVISIKKNFYNNNSDNKIYCEGSPKLPIGLDYTSIPDNINATINSEQLDEILARLQLSSFYRNPELRFYIDRIYIGLNDIVIPNNKSINQVFSQIRNIQQLGIKAVFVFPVFGIKGQSFAENIIDQFGQNNIHPDEYVVGDKQSYEFLCNRVSVPIALGRTVNIIREINLNEHSSNNERNSIISKDNREWISNKQIAYIMCEMPHNGLWVASSETAEIKIVLPEKTILEMSCSHSLVIEKKGRERIESYRKIINSILENRAEIVISL